MDQVRHKADLSDQAPVVGLEEDEKFNGFFFFVCDEEPVRDASVLFLCQPASRPDPLL